MTPEQGARVEAAVADLSHTAELLGRGDVTDHAVRESATELMATVASLVAEAVAAERERWEDECLDALRSVYPAGRNRAAVVEAIRRIGQTDPARIHDAEARDDGPHPHAEEPRC